MVILYVEDDVDDQQLFEEALKDVNPSTTLILCDSKAAAFDKLSCMTELPDLIITDMNLKGGSGWDLLLDVRSNDKLKHLPVIVLTTSANQLHRRLSLSNGATEYIIKPCLYSEICLLIARLGIEYGSGALT